MGDTQATSKILLLKHSRVNANDGRPTVPGEHPGPTGEVFHRNMEDVPVGSLYQLAVIGGGPAGLAAALAAWQRGLRRILIIERDAEPGGILNQCIHNGFGLHWFREELTGPEYAGRFIAMVRETGIELALDTMVVQLTPQRELHLVGKETGYRVIRAESVVLAMGCRERTRGAIGIPGSRPAGVLTAGAAQRYVNREGYLPGKRVVILGSGDIGLIMARRMVLEGAEVLACVEVLPHSGGLTRNLVQCLEDFGIPLYLSHTVTEIRGERRLEEVVVSRVDESRTPVPGTEMTFHCDTLLLSVGLIPENELTRQAGIEMDPRTGGAVVNGRMETGTAGIFACGNVLHVHDLVDFVTAESTRAGEAAADYVLSQGQEENRACRIVEAGDGIGYTVPQRLLPTEADAELFFRVRRVFGKSRIRVVSGDGELAVFHRQHMAPGEMEQVRLSAGVLKQAGDCIRLIAEECVE